MSANRQPVRAIRASASEVANAAKADRARKAASKAAAKAAVAAQNAATFGAPTPKTEPTPKPDHTAQDRANALETARVDAEALGVAFEQQCAEMGIDPKTGAPVVVEHGLSPGAISMLPLRAAALHYVRGVHCADDIGMAFDVCTAAQTIAIVGKILVEHGVLEVRNPYLHLNPGQQSMNLRNKLRGAIKNGFVKIGEVQDAITEHMLPKAA